MPGSLGAGRYDVLPGSRDGLVKVDSWTKRVKLISLSARSHSIAPTKKDATMVNLNLLDAVLTPVRPYLKPIIAAAPSPVHNLGISLLGNTCYTTIVRDLNVSVTNNACVKLAISKVLGVGIIAASAVVKVPQLVKLLNSQSATGLSFLSYVLETASYTISLAYNARHGFPFSTYGETAFIAVQDVVIAVLILVYSGRGALAGVFGAGLAAAMYALFFSGSSIVDMKTLGYLQAGAGALGVASKVPQIMTIWQQGGTGQLSAFAVSYGNLFPLFFRGCG